MTGAHRLRREIATVGLAVLLAAGWLVLRPAVVAGTDDPLCADNRAACGTVTVNLTGYGTGLMTTVTTFGGTTEDGRIHCFRQFGANTGDCRARFFVGTLPGQTRTVFWRATAGPDSTPTNWGSLTLHAGEGLTLTQSFDLVDPGWISVTISSQSTGTGRVTSDPPGINCPAVCEWYWDYGTAVVLTATADAGSAFWYWNGFDCSTSNPVCGLVANNDGGVAAFRQDLATQTPGPTKTPTPTVTPTKTPAPTKTPSPSKAPTASPGTQPTTGASGQATQAPGTSLASPLPGTTGQPGSSTAASTAPTSAPGQSVGGSVGGVPPGGSGSEPSGAGATEPPLDPAGGSAGGLDGRLLVLVVVIAAIGLVGLLVTRRLSRRTG